MDLGWGDFFGNLVQSNGENDGHESDADIPSFSNENPLQKTETWARTSTEYYEGLTAMEMEDIMDQVSAGAQSNGGSFEDDGLSPRMGLGRPRRTRRFAAHLVLRTRGRGQHPGALEGVLHAHCRGAHCGRR